jgi:hypothetical protein
MIQNEDKKVNVKMNAKTMRLIFFFAFSAIVVSLYYKAVLLPGELGSKREWSVLESAEINFGSDLKATRHVLVSPSSDNGTEFDLIRILPTIEGPRVWIMASPNAVPRLKIFPSGVRIRISREDFKFIVSSVQLNEETKTYLQNAVND